MVETKQPVFSNPNLSLDRCKQDPCPLGLVHRDTIITSTQHAAGLVLPWSEFYFDSFKPLPRLSF